MCKIVSPLYANLVDTRVRSGYGLFMRTRSAADLRVMLKEKMGTGSIRQCARTVGISHAYLYDVLAGRRDPGKKVLDFLGYERVATKTVEYRKVRD